MKMAKDISLSWRRRTSTSKHSRGQAILEVAATLPFFVMVILGATVFAVVCYYSIEVCSAARAGVQYGMQNHATASDNTGMQTVALQNMANVPGKTAVATSFCQCSNALGTNVSCTSSACSGTNRLIEFVQVSTSATASYKDLPQKKRCSLFHPKPLRLRKR